MITTRKRLAAPLLTPLVGLAMASTVLGAPAASAATTVPLSDCASTDNGKPVVSSFQLGTHTANVRGGEDRIPVTAVVDDTGGPGPATGVESVQVVLSIPGSRDSLQRRVAQLLAPSGDGRTWQGTLTLPRGIASGTWSADLTVADKADVVAALGPEELRAIGSDPDVAVQSSGIDRTAPALRALTVSRKQVDTRNSSRRVTVTVRAADAGSGVGKVVVSARAKKGLREATATLRLVSGTRTSGTWRSSIVIPRWAGNSSWRLVARMDDRVHNITRLGAVTLARRGQPSAIAVRSRSDRAAPTITDVRVSPTSIDVRDADRVLRVSARVTDTGSGVTTATAMANAIGSDYERVTLHRAAGTRYAGRWTGRLVLHRCQGDAEPGLHPLSLAQTLRLQVAAGDGAGRWRQSRPSSRPLVEATFRDNDYPLPEVFLDSAGHVVVGFGQAVVSNGHWDPYFAPAAGGPEVAGTWACTGEGSAAVDCATGELTRAAFTPATPLSPGLYDMAINRDHTLHVVDLAGNPVLAAGLFVLGDR